MGGALELQSLDSRDLQSICHRLHEVLELRIGSISQRKAATSAGNYLFEMRTAVDEERSTQRLQYLDEHQDPIRGIGGFDCLNEHLDLASVSTAALGFVLIGPELIPMHNAGGPDRCLTSVLQYADDATAEPVSNGGVETG